MSVCVFYPIHAKTWVKFHCFQGYSDMRDQNKAAGENNPFTKMGMVKFWTISTIVYLTFPVSLIVSYIAFGPLLTKQLVIALLQDFLQTLLVAIGALIVLILVIFYYLGPIVAGWFVG